MYTEAQEGPSFKIFTQNVLKQKIPLPSIFQTAEYGTFRRDLGCGKPGQLIFRCARSFSGAEKYLQARLRCALGAGIKVRAAGLPA